MARLILWIIGWKVENRVGAIPSKCVAIGAPHTSWTDMFVGLSASVLFDLKLTFLAKKEMFIFPFSSILRSLGGIAVDRYSKEGLEGRKKMVADIVREFEERDRLLILMTPEGTRKRVVKWKLGFYNIAIAAKVPLVFAHFDWDRKTGVVAEVYHPTGDQVQDLTYVMNYFSKIPVRYNDRFSIDLRYQAQS